jgi:succinate dehydrogenase / fumarate reductase iron-sulfur subunit
MMNPLRLKIRRQLSPEAHPYWEIFEVPRSAPTTVLSALLALRAHPVDAEGAQVTPVAFEGGCLEEVCGACTMVINGRARPACTARLAELPEPVTVEPLRSFAVLRDLCVDRARVTAGLNRVQAWTVVDGTHDPGVAAVAGETDRKMDPVTARRLIELSRCTLCAACLDACPQYPATGFVGAAVIHRVYTLGEIAGRRGSTTARLEGLMLPGGIEDCGNAQNCVKACPQGLPLAESIAATARQVTIAAVKKLFG